MGVRRSIYGSGGASSSPARAGGTTTASAKVPFFNVLDYGAKGDGTTDDSAAIQAAINAVNVNRGGTVFLPQGKYYVATGLTATSSGTTIIGEAQTGVSDDLASGSTQIIVGNGIWGLSVGVDGTSNFRGYRVEDLHFYEQNAGQALGGLRIRSASDGSYTRVSAGSFTAGTGILLDGHDGATQAQYNTFTDCRVGKCLVGFENKFANGTRWIGGYAEGSHNGQAPTASSVGFKLTSGDTFRSIGTVFQGYDTLISVAGVYNPEFHAARFEVWTTAAISVASGCNKGKFQGDGDNSLNSNSGIGINIASGALDIVDNTTFRNVKTKRVDNGTRTRYPGRQGLGRGAAIMGSITGAVPQYDDSGTQIGYAPLYDTATGVYLVQNLGGNLGSTGVTTVTRTLTAPVNVGDMVVVGGGYGNGSTVTVTITDSKSNTWTTNQHNDLLTGATPHSYIGSSVLTTGLAVGDTITATFSGTVNYPMIFAYDYAGQIAGTILDVAGGATGTGTAVSSGNITASSDYPLVFAVTYFDQAATFTAGTGFTSLDNQTSTGKTVNVETGIGPQAGTYVGATGTLSSSVDWAMSVATFKKVAGGSAPLLPSQTGNSGKFLTTNGTVASWGTPGAGALTNSSNVMSADVTMTTAGTVYDGPTLTLAAGTWLLIGAVQVFAVTNASRTFDIKLWDGTTSYCTPQYNCTGSATAASDPVPVVAIVTPGGSTTYKISAKSTVNGDKILGTGTSGSYLNAIKIA